MIVDPSQTNDAPVITAGRAFTVTTCVEKHPVAVTIYDTVDIPVLKPAKTPVPELIVPIAKFDEDHVPDGVLLLNVIEEPSHTKNGAPPIAAGLVFTVTTAVLKHPLPGSV